ncbi:tyrosine-type recombinase/integrase [Gordonia amicalis]|uniref:tyrosine-type recombinase/integrase n=1 Tax=Gordonia amicalis TaxID=89053 RepID=UPI00295371A2|nr:tyrosine-type recombinase/integrase [Gordonia amicalis]MDV7099693.1 tyrosine-type recombinase/integrase [Gordonia amicalis]
MRPQRRVRVDVADSWARPIERWADSARRDGLAESTVYTRSTALMNLARGIQQDAPDPSSVTTETLRRYIEGRTWQPSTYRNNVKAIRAFYRDLHSQGVMVVDPARVIPVAISGSETERMRVRALASTDRPFTGPPPLPVPTGWAKWIEDYRRYLRAGGRTAQTVDTRIKQLGTLARALDPIDPEEVTFDDLVDYLAENEDWKPETRRSVRGSVRAFFEWAVGDGRLADSPAARLPKVKPGRVEPRPAAEHVYADALIGADDRVRLMLRLGAELGMRRAEVACAHTQDLIRTDGSQWWLVVHGKGRRDRNLPLTTDLAAAIRSHTKEQHRYLFPSADGKSHLSARYVGQLVRRQLPAGVTMHQLRHRFATQAYAVSRDLLMVQRLLGHSSPATTQRYVAVDDSAMRSIVEAVGARRPRAAASTESLTAAGGVR